MSLRPTQIVMQDQMISSHLHLLNSIPLARYDHQAQGFWVQLENKMRIEGHILRFILRNKERQKAECLLKPLELPVPLLHPLTIGMILTPPHLSQLLQLNHDDEVPLRPKPKSRNQVMSIALQLLFIPTPHHILRLRHLPLFQLLLLGYLQLRLRLSLLLWMQLLFPFQQFLPLLQKSATWQGNQALRHSALLL